MSKLDELSRTIGTLEAKQQIALDVLNSLEIRTRVLENWQAKTVAYATVAGLAAGSLAGAIANRIVAVAFG